MPKKWYTSKTLWVNAIAAAALILQAKFGFIFDIESQGALLVIVNLILRVITKEEIVWKDPK